MAINWERFVDPRDLHRGVSAPWVVGGHKIATDARCLIRVPSDEPDSIERGCRYPKVGHYFEHTPVGVVRPWPSLASHCANCKGTGWIQQPEPQCPKCKGKKIEPCATCNGTGYEECDLGHEHDCSDCDGVRTTDCLDCDGDGIIPADTIQCEACHTHVTTYVGGKRVSLYHATSISELPDPVMFYDDGTVGVDPIHFTFGDDGRGVVMPRPQD